MSNDKLWHYLEHHARLETFTGASFGHIADRVLKQVDESLIRVDCLDLSFVFLGLVVKDLLLDLVRLLLAKVKWKPVCEPFLGD